MTVSRRRPVSPLVLAALAAVCLIALPCAAAAQAVSAAERDALIKLRVDRGGRADEVDPLIRQADAAAQKGLPIAPITNKIREGFAKGHDPKRIEAVVSQLTVHLDSADRIVREMEPGATVAGREPAVTLLAEALGGGVTVNEVRELQRLADTAALPSLELAGAAKGLSFIKEAKLPASDGTAVMAAAARQRFRSYEMLDVGREIKRREADYRSGRASLLALRDMIASGVRAETLLRESRAATAERPALMRPDATGSRPERPQPVDRPQRPERPPDRPASPGGDRGR